MNAGEVAKLLDMHPDTIRRLIREGKIKAEKKGRSYIIPQSEVDALKRSKGKESLAQAQEKAAMQLIVNVNSEIEAVLSEIQMYAEQFLPSDMKMHDISANDYSYETFEKRRRVYEEVENNPLSIIVEASKNIDRLYKFRSELEDVIKYSEKDNTFDKSLDNWKKFVDYDPAKELSIKIERSKGDNNEEA